jgi:3-hydroxyisobutyrate dehydrogenase-like beta-hydroxyacid dehydrogenase
MSDDDHYTKLVTKVKRGSGTRDQDTTKVVTRHPDPQTAVKNHRKAVNAAAQDFTESARELQP